MSDPLLTDIAFTDDIGKTASGDIDVMSGEVNLREALFRRLMTKPGTLVHRPDYGVGLVEFRNAPATIAVQRQLAKRIAEQFPRDPRVRAINKVSVSSEDYTPEKLIIAVSVEAIGVGNVTLEYTPFNEVVV